MAPVVRVVLMLLAVVARGILDAHGCQGRVEEGRPPLSLVPGGRLPDEVLLGVGRDLGGRSRLDVVPGDAAPVPLAQGGEPQKEALVLLRSPRHSGFV